MSEARRIATLPFGFFQKRSKEAPDLDQLERRAEAAPKLPQAGTRDRSSPERARIRNLGFGVFNRPSKETFGVDEISSEGECVSVLRELVQKLSTDVARLAADVAERDAILGASNFEWGPAQEQALVQQRLKRDVEQLAAENAKLHEENQRLRAASHAPSHLECGSDADVAAVMRVCVDPETIANDEFKEQGVRLSLIHI